VGIEGDYVDPLARAVARFDFLATVMGDKYVVDRENFAVVNDGFIIANAGHFNVGINIPSSKEHPIAAHRESDNLSTGTRQFQPGG
jgi:adenosylhomocysteinase